MTQYKLSSRITAMQNINSEPERSDLTTFLTAAGFPLLEMTEIDEERLIIPHPKGHAFDGDDILIQWEEDCYRAVGEKWMVVTSTSYNGVVIYNVEPTMSDVDFQYNYEEV